MSENENLSFKEKLAQEFKKELDNSTIKESEKNEGLKSENDKGNKEELKSSYTIEDLRKLKEKEGEKAFDKVKEDKLEPELVEKYKLLQGMATKRQQYIAQKEKELDETLAKIGNYSKQLEQYVNLLERRLGEEAVIDEDLEKALKEIKENKGAYGEIKKELWERNWQEAELKVREIFPEFGVFGDEEMTKTLKENPRLLQLASVNNGEFGDIVLAATHILTLLKEENFKKLIKAELINNPDKYSDIIDEVIGKKIEEIEKKNEKAKNFSNATKPQEKKEPTISGSKKGYASRFKEEYMKLANDESYLQDTLQKVK